MVGILFGPCRCPGSAAACDRRAWPDGAFEAGRAPAGQGHIHIPLCSLIGVVAAKRRLSTRMATAATAMPRRREAGLSRPAASNQGLLRPFRIAWLFSSEGRRQGFEGLRHRVLLIEDDPDIARMYKLALRQAGLNLTIASEGTAGLAELRRQRYDLVLLDLGLPGHHGFEVLDRIRLDQELGDPKVVIVSNYSENATIQEGLARGAVDYVVKSNVTPRELTQLVARWLLG